MVHTNMVYELWGSILNIAILDTSKDFQTRLICIVYSWVKTSQSLIFNKPFNLSALQITLNYTFIIRITNKVRKLLKKLLIPGI